MIIITGTDNTGKSTLAMHLSNKFGIPIMERYPQLPPKDYDDWYRFIVQMLDKDEEQIADRFYIDELVYGPVVRGKVGITEHQLKVMNKLVAEEKPLVILCHREISEISRSYSERDQYLDAAKIGEVQNSYFEVTDKPPFKDITIGYCIEDDPYYEKIDFQVALYLKKQEVLKNER